MAKLPIASLAVAAHRDHEEIEVYRNTAEIALNSDFDTPKTDLWPAAAAGDWIERGAMQWANIVGQAEQDADNDGVVIEQSLDGSTVHDTVYLLDEDGDGSGGTNVSANKLVNSLVRLTLPYWRFRWQNGVTAGVVNVRVTAY